jgi:hypothetical protein
MVLGVWVCEAGKWGSGSWGQGSATANESKTEVIVTIFFLKVNTIIHF